MILTLHEIVRLGVLFSHLLLCALAITQVLRADIGIMTGRFTRHGLQTMAHEIAVILGMLWISGLLIVYLDTGFDPIVLSEKPKILLKLLCVIVLTVNGFVLHRISFPVLAGDGQLSTAQSILLACTGALSTSHWLMAAFVGVARPLGRIAIDKLLVFYVGICLFTLLVSLAFSPVVRRRITNWRLAQSLGQLARRPVIQ